ncbi:MAG TPA: recombination protein NinB [Casimicrobium huifangae]|nr:recombination protein NinB [Casimicrobium huifangae]
MSTFILRESNARDRMKAAWDFACQILQHPGKAARVRVEECQPTRTLDQNAKLQVLCGEVASQVEWHGRWLSKDDWRHMFVAAYRKEQRIVPGVNGGFVVLGDSSRRLSIGECSDVIELIHAFGAEHGVQFKESVHD